MNLALAALAAIELLAWQDLPKDDPRIHGLSGLAWNGTVLLAVRDHPSAILELIPGEGLRSFTLGSEVPLELQDTEAIGLVEGGYLVADERLEGIFKVTPQGKITGKIEIPAIFATPQFNRGIEAMGTTPDQRYVFFTSEEPLRDDGKTLRLVRKDLQTGKTLMRRYRTEARPPEGFLGVSDVVPLNAREALVLERGYIPEHGNRIRIFHIDMASSSLRKRLFFDLTSISDKGVPSQPQPQPNQHCANYEGVSLGPLLPDGRRVIFMISDDNENPLQVARILVLAVSGLH